MRYCVYTCLGQSAQLQVWTFLKSSSESGDIIVDFKSFLYWNFYCTVQARYCIWRHLYWWPFLVAPEGESHKTYLRKWQSVYHTHTHRGQFLWNHVTPNYINTDQCVLARHYGGKVSNEKLL